MYKKVMLVFSDGKRRWGHATDEIDNGTLKIIMGGKSVDGYTHIITGDEELADLLRDKGYPVEGVRAVKMGLSVPVMLHAKIKKDAEHQNRTVHNMIIQILEDYYANQDYAEKLDSYGDLKQPEIPVTVEGKEETEEEYEARTKPLII